MKTLSSAVSEPLIPKKNNYLQKKDFPKFNDDEHEFIAFLAHEVRNPLGSIKLSAEILYNILEDNDQKEYLEIIMRNSVRINDLITRLLTYQKHEREIASHSVNGLLTEVLNIVHDRMKLKNITVIKTFSADDFVIVVNEEKMKIAFTNIIVNAIDAMPSEKGILKLSGKYIEGKYVIEIEDNGCGISEAHLESIFDAGFTNKPGGLGFGLQITKTILEANNVEIKVESDESVFTRFTLLFNTYVAANEGNICRVEQESMNVQNEE